MCSFQLIKVSGVVLIEDCASTSLRDAGGVALQVTYVLKIIGCERCGRETRQILFAGEWSELCSITGAKYESKEGIIKIMAKPVLEDYVTVTRKNYISGNDRGEIIDNSFLELKGTFMIKIRDNAFSGTNGEDTIEHIEKFLEVVGPLKLPNLSDDQFRLSVFPISLTGAASDWFKEECIGKDSEKENEIAEIFRIKTDIFDYESPVPWVNEKPWKLDGVWKEHAAVKHRCKPFCFKSGHSEWPTCNWRDEEYFNGGNLPAQFQVGNTIHYQDYEWYEALEDSDLKDEARNKAALEESINQDEGNLDAEKREREREGYLACLIGVLGSIFNNKKVEWEKEKVLQNTNYSEKTKEVNWRDVKMDSEEERQKLDCQPPPSLTVSSKL
ncbi:hypothetical protein Tco_0742711 [Tanacetum coccineum]